MKISKPILALSCALLLAGCADPVTTTDSLSESESSSAPASLLEELVDKLANQNYTATATLRSGAQMLATTTDISISPEQFFYLQGEDEGIYYGHVGQGTAAVMFSGEDVLDAQLLSPAKVNPLNFVYMVIDIIGDGSDWELVGDEYVAGEGSNAAAMAAAYLGYDIESVDCYSLTLVITEDGANISYGLGTSGQVDMTADIAITAIGTTSYNCPAAVDVTFAAPTEWGQIVDYYAPSLGLDFPTGAFGAGYYATIDDYYGVVTIVDPTVDFDSFKATIDPLLEAAGYALDEEYSVDGTYSWYTDDVYFDYTYYTPEETGSSEIYPQGLLYVDIWDMSTLY